MRHSGKKQNAIPTKPSTVVESRLSLALVFFLVLDDMLPVGTVNSFFMVIAASIFFCSTLALLEPLAGMDVVCTQLQLLCSMGSFFPERGCVAVAEGDDVCAAADDTSVFSEVEAPFPDVVVVSATDPYEPCGADVESVLTALVMSLADSLVVSGTDTVEVPVVISGLALVVSPVVSSALVVASVVSSALVVSPVVSSALVVASFVISAFVVASVVMSGIASVVV